MSIQEPQSHRAEVVDHIETIADWLDKASDKTIHRTSYIQIGTQLCGIAGLIPVHIVRKWVLAERKKRTKREVV